ALGSGKNNQIQALKNTLDQHNNLGSDLDQHGHTSGPQFAAVNPDESPVPVSPLTFQELTPVVAEAVLRWRSAGAMLTAGDFQLVIADLPDGSGTQTPLDALQVLNHISRASRATGM